jgi:hypothetical protein
MSLSLPQVSKQRGNAASTVLLVLFLVACIAVGGFFVWRQIQGQVDAGPHPLSGKVNDDGGSALLESYGTGDAVTVYGAYPGSDCHDAIRHYLHGVAEEHPDVINVQVYPMGSEEVVEKLGTACAGWAIYTKEGDSDTQVACFMKSPAMGGWTEEELHEAVETALADATNVAAEAEAATAADEEPVDDPVGEA